MKEERGKLNRGAKTIWKIQFFLLEREEKLHHGGDEDGTESKSKKSLTSSGFLLLQRTRASLAFQAVKEPVDNDVSGGKEK